MPDTFVAIDFETADPQPDSACAVGLVRVEGSELVRRAVSLVRPPRPSVHPACFRVHGLSWAYLRRERPFEEVWPALTPVLDGVAFLAAHNASFDRRVLEACCGAAGLTPPALPWVCTVALARKLWGKGTSNRLPDVCERLKVPLKKHHEAGADAEACARVYLALWRASSLRPPPALGPYWAIGRDPAGRMRMEEYGPGEGCPVWMTHWCVTRDPTLGSSVGNPTGGDWVLFGPADAAELIPPEDRPGAKPVPTLFGG